jgi:hypothetical protein
MTVAILKYDLSDEGDRSDFRLAQNAGGFHSTLWDLDQFLRGRLKYEELPEEVDTALRAVRDKLWELMADNEVRFEP